MRVLVETAGQVAEASRRECVGDLAVARGGMLVGVLHRVAQRADRNVGLLRQEQHARPGGHVHMAVAEWPDAGQRAEQCALARAARAGDQGRLAPRKRQRRVRQQHLAVGQRERETFGRDVGPPRLGYHLDRAIGLVVGCRLQADQAIHDGAQLGQDRVVVDEERERALHLAEGRRRLGHHAERNGAGKEPRRRHEIGEDDRELGIARLVEGELRLGEQHAPAVVEHVGEARVECLGLVLLAAIEGDALGILAHAHQREAEIRLEALLLEVERDQATADQVGQQRAAERIDQADPRHVAGHVDVEADGDQRQGPR